MGGLACFFFAGKMSMRRAGSSLTIYSDLAILNILLLPPLANAASVPPSSLEAPFSVRSLLHASLGSAVLPRPPKDTVRLSLFPGTESALGRAIQAGRPPPVRALRSKDRRGFPPRVWTIRRRASPDRAVHKARVLWGCSRGCWRRSLFHPDKRAGRRRALTLPRPG